MQAEPTVLVVDDDWAVRDSLEELIAGTGLAVKSFSSAHEFLNCYEGNRPACLLLDICMPEMTGLELQERLVDEYPGLPVIIITGHGDVPAATRSFKLGASDFLQKPFKEDELLSAIRTALDRDTRDQRQNEHAQEIAGRIAQLSAREQQVMDLVIAGYPNKCIATELGITQRTVEVHRAHIMSKMKADSLPELVRLVLALQSGRSPQVVRKPTVLVT